VRAWVEEERSWNTDGHGQTWTNTDGHGQPPTSTRKKETEKIMSVQVGESPCESVQSSVLVANAALSLLNLCCYLLDRQIATQAGAFEQEGGFTERLYRVRSSRRKQ
jgi:four helix bundle suffix protein